MKKIGTLLLCLWTLSLGAQTLSERSVISLMTCTPGDELYLNFGHSALRVLDPALILEDSTIAYYDITFNYGIFSFDTDYFYWKFAKGHTDYQLGLQYTSSFFYCYEVEDRAVYEQVLNLTLEERQQVFDALMENYRPENREYRYNFVYDNCATRPFRLIQAALPEWQVPDSLLSLSYRQQIDYYTGRWSWGKFAINLAFGRKADRPITLQESLFLPENLMNFVHESGIASREDISRFVPREHSFLSSPELLIVVLCLLIVLLTLWEMCHGKIYFWLDGTLYLVFGLAGAILVFLSFFSSHPLVEENINALYLSPLWLVAWVCCFFRKGQTCILRFCPLIAFSLFLCLCMSLIWGQTFHPVLVLPLLACARMLILRQYIYLKK